MEGVCIGIVFTTLIHINRKTLLQILVLTIGLISSQQAYYLSTRLASTQWISDQSGIQIMTVKWKMKKAYLAPSKIGNVFPAGSLKLQALTWVSAVQTRLTSSPTFTVTSWWFCSIIFTDKTPAKNKKTIN